MIQRLIKSQLLNDLFTGKAIVLTGPRQVGKTTLLEVIRREENLSGLWLNCDEPDVRAKLEGATSTLLKSLIGEEKIVFIDEAQRVRNIGLTLKLMVDNFKNVQVIATGSSALELANEMNEPLTGRKWEYHLYPLSTIEMINHTSRLEEQRLLHQRLVFGLYPDVVNRPDRADTILMELANNYLYKDLLSLEAIRKPMLLEKLLQALALQIGNEVSFAELAQTVGAEQRTVEHYIQLLEKAFIVFTVTAFSRNLRNEIKKGKKVYFYDNGIRNALIKNFNPVNLRQDTGALWENFLVCERRKANAYAPRFVNTYFWRTHAQQEIDLVEETGGQLHATEFKWNPKKVKNKLPTAFASAYPGTTFECITPENYLNFLSNVHSGV